MLFNKLLFYEIFKNIIQMMEVANKFVRSTFRSAEHLFKV